MKTVIITGANGNLGTAVTRLFLEKGYRVVVTVANESMRNDFTPHPQLEVEVVNLMDEAATAASMDTIIGRHKEIYAVLMLVGGFAMGTLVDTTAADLHKQLALNFETAYHVTRPLYSHMQHTGKGRLVYIGARPAIEPQQGKNMIAYGLSKSLLFTMAEYINAESKGKNITATVVVPSTLDTPLNRKSMPDADPADWVTPAALAEILSFVVSDTASPLRETVLKVYNNA
jgi:NAD(P)-dependent dehydrogenase (short-subunit alcohol dehydrogenase family)